MDERSIFMAALEAGTPAGRSAYLDEACGGDAALRRRVEALLASHEQAGSFLGRPVPERLAGGPEETRDEAPPAEGGPRPPAEAVGGRIGPYKLLQEVGEGGMGTVWMAQQTEPVKRLVALKVIKPGMDSKQVLARFEAERQALALMDHPNIARVLDAATTETGRPYFVMELVKGVSITRYCDENRLTPRQRLELFVPVCQAIQHAHQKGVIHRDVKPSNVLVCQYDGRPVPKVIDFGIAKATGQQLTEMTLATGFGSVVGTLEYMSPEQAESNQLDIDTRSDVYSLGVLLYELLTGSTPLEKKRLKQAAMLEILRLIRDEEPPRPSTRLSTGDGMPSVAANRGLEPKRLSDLVRGELDWIVMKALEKDRKRRYETANGFAQDVQRYLADEPVQACPPSAGYRLRKFTRRNKGPMFTAALVAAALLAGTAVSVWQAVRATNALENERQTRAALDQERSQTNGRIIDSLQEVAALRGKVRAAGPANGKLWAELQEVLRRADTLAGSELADPGLIERVRHQSEQVRQDANNRRLSARLEEIRLESLAGLPGTPAERGVGPAYAAAFREYGLPVLDLPAAESAARVRGSDFRDDLLAALEAWAVWDARAGGTAWKRLLVVAQGADDHPWRRECRDAVLRGDRPTLVRLARREDSPRQPAVAVLLLAGTLASSRSRPAMTEEDTAAGLLLEKAGVWHPEDPRIAFGLAAWFPGRSPLRDEFANAREIIERLEKNASDPVLLAAAHFHLGDLLSLKKKDSVGAVSAFRQAVRLAPGRADYRTRLIGNLSTLDEKIAACSDWIASGPRSSLPYLWRGHYYHAQGRSPQALADLVKATELNPDDASAWEMQAQVHIRMNRGDEALVAHTKAIEAAKRNGKDQARYFACRAYTHGIRRRQWDEAIEDATQAIDLEPKEGWYRIGRGDIYREKGDLHKALADYDMAIKMTVNMGGRHVSPGTTLSRRADIHARLGRWDRAIRDYTEVEEKFPEACLPTNLFAILITCPNRALRDPRRALALDRKYGQTLWKHLPEDRFHYLGKAHFQLREWKKSIAEMAKLPDRYYDAGFYIAMAHWHLGNRDEARKCYDRAVKLTEQASSSILLLQEVRECWDEAKKLLASPKKEK